MNFRAIFDNYDKKRDRVKLLPEVEKNCNSRPSPLEQLKELTMQDRICRVTPDPRKPPKNAIDSVSALTTGENKATTIYRGES